MKLIIKDSEVRINMNEDQETYNIIGAAIEVHRQLGPGFVEFVYADALEIELKLRGIPFQREVRIPVEYKGSTLKHVYVADFICYDHVIVELKAAEKILPVHEAQIINYLKATNYHCGLLLNFSDIVLQKRRYVN